MSETPRQALHPNGETRALNNENQSKSRDILPDYPFENPIDAVVHRAAIELGWFKSQDAPKPTS